jgi:hypothetical protein
MDVKNASLNGYINEEIYMEHPEGYVQDPSLVCRLRKSLYGLKQAPRVWYAKIDSYLLSRGFIRCRSYPNVYMMRNIYSLVLKVLYVDDLLITESSTSSIVAAKIALHDMFSMIDMGLLHYFLGFEISQNDSGIKMSQFKYVIDLLDRFQMTYCKPTPTPFQLGVRLEDVGASPLIDCTRYRKLVGSILYLTQFQPNISYVVGSVSRYM